LDDKPAAASARTRLSTHGTGYDYVRNDAVFSARSPRAARKRLTALLLQFLPHDDIIHN
jgi:hypothetical protein